MICCGTMSAGGHAVRTLPNTGFVGADLCVGPPTMPFRQLSGIPVHLSTVKREGLQDGFCSLSLFTGQGPGLGDVHLIINLCYAEALIPNPSPKGRREKNRLLSPSPTGRGI